MMKSRQKKKFIIAVINPFIHDVFMTMEKSIDDYKSVIIEYIDNTCLNLHMWCEQQRQKVDVWYTKLKRLITRKENEISTSIDTAAHSMTDDAKRRVDAHINDHSNPHGTKLNQTIGLSLETDDPPHSTSRSPKMWLVFKSHR